MPILVYDAKSRPNVTPAKWLKTSAIYSISFTIYKCSQDIAVLEGQASDPHEQKP